MNLKFIKKSCDLKIFSSKEENKSNAAELDYRNYHDIESQVQYAVKAICDRLNTLKEVEKYPELRQHFYQGIDI